MSAAPQETFPLVHYDQAAMGESYPHVPFEISLSEMARFYATLPHPDKPSLANVEIHIQPEQGRDDGYTLLHGKKKSAIDPVTGRLVHHIHIYTGSSVRGNSPDAAIEQLNATITHELTHVAQSGGDEYRIALAALLKARDERSKLSRTAISALLYPVARAAYLMHSVVTDGYWLLGGAMGSVVSASGETAGSGISYGTGIAVAGLVHAARFRKHVRRVMEDRHLIYLKEDKEVDARQHETAAYKIFQIAQK